MIKRKFIFHVFKHFTFRKLKTLYSEKVSEPDSDQFIYSYKGKTLKKEYNSLTLEKLDIIDSSTVYIVGRVNGGNA